jgi:ELWxxDGT repeat protein
MRRTIGSAVVAVACVCVQTASGDAPFLVKDIDAGGANRGSMPLGMTNLDGVAYFAATDAAHGCELWRSDGSPIFTFQVVHLVPGAVGSSPHQLVRGPEPNTVVFSAWTPARGVELWVSAGMAGNMRRLSDIAPERDGSGPWEPTVAGDLLFYAADDGVRGRQLWARGEAPCGCPGDANRDGVIDFDDISYFVAGLQGYDYWVWFHAAQAGVSPACSYDNCDADLDGRVTFADIGAFVALLGTGCP